MCTSDPQTFARRTFTSTAPGSGSGTSNSLTATSAGPVTAATFPLTLPISFPVISPMQRMHRIVHSCRLHPTYLAPTDVIAHQTVGCVIPSTGDPKHQGGWVDRVVIIVYFPSHS